MEILRGHVHMPETARGAAVAIGNFDGVHLGHRALLRTARERADHHGVRAVALTFEPHPSAVLSPKGAPPRISSLERRVELIASCGIDTAVVEPFTRELAALQPEAFVEQVLIGALGARAVIVGYDFNYGCERAGSIATLRAHGERAGFEVIVVDPVELEGAPVSSTRVRQALRAGDLAAANRLLARPWDVDGTVIHGAKRGRTIGVPTANIAPDSELLIAPGIYAVTLGVVNSVSTPWQISVHLPAVASLGRNPTFVDGGSYVLEVHVLDWDGDLYDQRVRTTFVARLRDELKFDSVDALVDQIHRDIADARARIAEHEVSAPRGV